MQKRRSAQKWLMYFGVGGRVLIKKKKFLLLLRFEAFSNNPFYGNQTILLSSCSYFLRYLFVIIILGYSSNCMFLLLVFYKKIKKNY